VARWSPKLPGGGVIGAWSLDDLPDPPAFWHKVAKATARHLSPADDDTRESTERAVAAAIENYVRDTEDEASAVPVGAAQARAAEVRRAASALAQALSARACPRVAQAESLIEEAAGGDPALSLRALHDGAHALVAACDRALTWLEVLAGERHFAPGEAWARFIAALADTFEAATGEAATAWKGPGAERPGYWNGPCRDGRLPDAAARSAKDAMKDRGR
jgi:hypothetical protein